MHDILFWKFFSNSPYFGRKSQLLKYSFSNKIGLKAPSNGIIWKLECEVHTTVLQRTTSVLTKNYGNLFRGWSLVAYDKWIFLTSFLSNVAQPKMLERFKQTLHLRVQILVFLHLELQILQCFLRKAPNWNN